MESMILAIDQGTTNTKALLVAPDGSIAAQASVAVQTTYPQPAWVEQDAIQIWQTVQQAIDACLAQVPAVELSAVAITNQRESVTAWERSSGLPLGPVVIWQCRRTADFCAELRQRALGPWLHARTGLTIDPLFSASKMRWLLQQIPDGTSRAARGEICLGTIDSWVLWQLTGGSVHACDLTNASRTQLLDLQQCAWIDELLAVFDIPRAALPTVLPSRAAFGETVACGALPAGIPILSMIGDSHAALFGQAGFEPGSIKATYGTGSSLMTPTATPVFSQHGLSTTIAWALAPDQVTYALEGNIAVSGATVQWLGEFLGVSEPATAIAGLAATVPDAGDVYLVPALVGLGAPHWNDRARGLISGLDRGSTLPQLARAAIEAIAFQVRDVFDVMQTEAGTPLQTLLADGGATRNADLMQFQADITGVPVQRSFSPEASPLGAAYLAGMTLGWWPSLAALAALPRAREMYRPLMDAATRARRYTGWQTAVRRSMYGTAE